MSKNKDLFDLLNWIDKQCNGNVVKTKKYICQECESILDVFANNFKSLAKDKNIYYCTSRYRISVEDNRSKTYPFIC